MAQPAAILNILVRANTANANLGLAKVNAQARMTAARFGEVDKSSKKSSQALRNVGRAATVVAGGGLLLLAAAGKKAFAEFEESEKATKQTEAVLKSTGNTAKVTAKEIEQLANQISLKSGIDDEAIQSGENLLLTFTKIRNETGKGNDIFNRSAQVITDMSVALGTDLKSAAIQVGKALQDPEKGITALRRVGVSFTTTQQDMITNWAQHGHQLKAQKFILRELTKEFGGSAAAQATSSMKLRVAWDNLMESFGKAFGPTLEKGMAALARFVHQMETGKGAGGVFADVLKAIGAAIEEVVVSFIHFGKWIGNAIHNITRFGHGVRDVLRAVWGFFSDTFNSIKRIFGNVMAFIFRKFATLFDVASHLPGIGGKFGDLRDKANRFADSVDKAGEKTDELRGEIRKLHGKELDIKVNLLLNDPATKPLVPFPHGGPGLQGRVEDAATKRGKKWALAHLDEIAPLLGAPGNMKGSLGLIQQISLAMGLSGGLGPGQGYRPGDPGYHGLGRALDNSGPAGAMMAFAQRMFSQFGSRLKELIYTPMRVGIKNGQPVNIEQFYGHATALDHYDHVHVAMRRGGGISGSGSGDKVPALLEPGEFVMNRNATRKAGPLLAALNKGIPRFATGGPVGQIWKFMRGHGFSQQQAAGWLGVFQKESHFSPSARNPTSGAFGLAQWLGSRLSALQSRPCWLSLGGQLNFVWRELMGPENGAFRAVRKARTPEGAARLIDQLYERSDAILGAEGYARSWFKRLGGRHHPHHPAHHPASHSTAGHDGKTAPWSNWAGTNLDPFNKYLPRWLRRKLRHAARLKLRAWMDSSPFAMDRALAELTPSVADDTKVARGAVSTWAMALVNAQRLGMSPARITQAATELKSARDWLAELTGTATTDTAEPSESVTLLRQLLAEANQRTAVSQAQYGVLKNMPFGGSFADGGIIPGPLGAPRVIVGHGGEVVGQPGGVQVIVNGDIVNVPRGKKAVEVRDVRGGSRAALPGRGGGITRLG